MAARSEPVDDLGRDLFKLNIDDAHLPWSLSGPLGWRQDALRCSSQLVGDLELQQEHVRR